MSVVGVDCYLFPLEVTDVHVYVVQRIVLKFN